MSEAKQAVEAEVREASCLEPGERKKRIRQLQLRWHPGMFPAKAVQHKHTVQGMTGDAIPNNSTFTAIVAHLPGLNTPLAEPNYVCCLQTSTQC